MTIENTLERIAGALERIANRYDGAASAPAATGAAAAPAAPAAATAGKRGRKGTAAAAPAAEPDADPTDLSLDGEGGGDEGSFLDDDDAAPEVEELTKDQVRAELVSLQTLTSAEVARDVLKRVGGAESLGKLAEDKYVAVVKEAKKLAAAAAAKKGKK